LKSPKAVRLSILLLLEGVVLALHKAGEEALADIVLLFLGNNRGITL
jgi:hypothetical protein